MKQYIDKNALITEINRLIAELVEEGENTMFEQGRISAFEDTKLFLDSLEVSNNVFIEKACEKLKKCMYDNLMFQGRLHREEVIETFVRDFKKYMEEQQ